MGEIVDPFRILLQVKSTSKLNSHKLPDGNFGIKIPIDLVMKWVRSDCLVVLVLWDVKNKNGYWCLPKDQTAEYSVYAHKYKSIRYLLESHNELTKDSVEHLIWKARIRNFNRLYLEYHSILDYRDTLGEDGEKIHLQRAITLFDCLKVLRIVQKNGLSAQYIKMHSKAKSKLAHLERDVSKEDIHEQAIILSLLGWVYKYMNKNGIPIPLLDALSDAMSKLLDDPTLYEKYKRVS